MLPPNGKHWNTQKNPPKLADPSTKFHQSPFKNCQHNPGNKIEWLTNRTCFSNTVCFCGGENINETVTRGSDITINRHTNEETLRQINTETDRHISTETPDLNIPHPKFRALVRTTRYDVLTVWAPGKVRHTVRMSIKYMTVSNCLVLLQ